MASERSFRVQRELKPDVGSRSKAALCALGAALFSIMIAFPPSGIANGFTVALLFFSVPLSLSYFKRTFSSRPSLEWDDSGLTDRTALFGEELFIPWSDIDSVGLSKRTGLVINLIDRASVLSGLGSGRRLDRFVNRLFGTRGITIGPTLGGIPARDLADAIQEQVLEFERRQLLDQPPNSQALKSPTS